MDDSLSIINKLFVDLFNDILSIEELSLKNAFFSDVSITEIHTIEAIGISERPTMSQVAKKLDITLGTLTVAIKNLVNKGLVERYYSQNDKRVVNIGLTKKGRTIFRLHEKFHKEMILESLKDLSKEEISILSGTLDKIHKFLNNKLISMKDN